MERDYIKWKRTEIQKARDFTLELGSTALLIIDMQYGGASRSEGQGKLAKQRGEEASLDYRFGRIEMSSYPIFKSSWISLGKINYVLSIPPVVRRCQITLISFLIGANLLGWAVRPKAIVSMKFLTRLNRFPESV